MKTKIVNMYDFEELSEPAQEFALDEVRKGNCDYKWYESVYEDAEAAGLRIRIKEFNAADISIYCRGNFINSAEDCANYIIDNHGEKCETYATAETYLRDKAYLIKSAPVNDDGEYTDEIELDCTLEDLEADFLQSILDDYSIILQQEWEYINSKEVILESINSNGYMFTIDGELTS
jgi:hypothetical protein